MQFGGDKPYQLLNSFVKCYLPRDKKIRPATADRIIFNPKNLPVNDLAADYFDGFRAVRLSFGDAQPQHAVLDIGLSLGGIQRSW